MVDANYSLLTKLASYAAFTTPWTTGHVKIPGGDARLIRASLNWTPSFLEVFRAIAGVGISYYDISPENLLGGGSSFTFGHVLAPHFRGGLEWRPTRPRIGIGFFVNYDHFNKRGKARGTGDPIDIFELNKFSIEPTVALYF